MNDGTPIGKYWALIASRHHEAAFGFLDAAYREPHRAYHNWRHVQDLLGKLSAFEEIATRVDLIAAAVFWHDAVYATQEPSGAPRADKENVRASVEAFRRYAKFEEKDQAAVAEMISATTNHLYAPPACEHYDGFAKDFDLFLDLDLSPLGAAWPEFEENLARIRFEYSYTPEKLFYLGRLSILQQFEAHRGSLFRLPETRALWSRQAFENFRRGKESLSARLRQIQSANEKKPQGGGESCG